VQKLAAVLLAGSLSVCFAAGPISGTFTIDGSVSVTETGITWTSNTNVADQATISSLGLSGSFAALAGATVGINDLTDLPGDQPVGVSFSNFDFIDFPSALAYPSLDANFFALGSGNPANCSTTGTPSAGQTCTLTASTIPSEPDGSPFTFLNTLNGSNSCCNTSATWDISGVTSDGLSTWSAIFASEFTVPYQTVLSNFEANGFVSDSFSAAITVNIESAPEPSALMLAGSGLILVSLRFRRRKK
jgi:hypothetical protein